MPERFEIYIVYKRRYINTLPFLFLGPHNPTGNSFLSFVHRVITHGGCRPIAAGVGRAFTAFSCVCLFVRTLKGKWLELSTPNLVHIYSIVVARHALSQRSKCQVHMVTKTVTVASDACCCCRRGSACRLPMFSRHVSDDCNCSSRTR